MSDTTNKMTWSAECVTFIQHATKILVTFVILAVITFPNLTKKTNDALTLRQTGSQKTINHI